MLLNIKDIKLCKQSYETVPEFIKDIGKLNISFSSGLNVICGSNGSGKSTIINCIKHHLGIGKVSYSADSVARTNHAKDNGEHKNKYKIELDRDPQDVFGVDGNAFFENDTSKNHTSFYAAGIDGMVIAFTKQSLSAAQGKMYAQQMLLEYFNKNMIQKHQKYVLLFDEPTLSMEPAIERQFFKYMKDWGQVMQIIVATNSPFCYHIPDVNYIEVEKGFIQKQEEFLHKISLEYERNHPKPELKVCIHANKHNICECAGDFAEKPCVIDFGGTCDAYEPKEGD